MLQIGAWICFGIAVVALVTLIHDYNEEERALKEIEENTLNHK